MNDESVDIFSQTEVDTITREPADAPQAPEDVDKKLLREELSNLTQLISTF